jgi:hypothetical protein
LVRLHAIQLIDPLPQKTAAVADDLHRYNAAL